MRRQNITITNSIDSGIKNQKHQSNLADHAGVAVKCTLFEIANTRHTSVENAIVLVTKKATVDVFQNSNLPGRRRLTRNHQQVIKEN